MVASLLEKLESRLELDPVADADLEKAKDTYAGISDTTLRFKIENMRNLPGALSDGGQLARKKCQLIEAELKRRQSKNWLQISRQQVSGGCKLAVAMCPHLELVSSL